MTETEIMSLLDQIATNPELSRRLANIVYSQLNAGVRIDPATDDEEMLKAIQHAPADINPNQYNLVTVDESGIHGGYIVNPPINQEAIFDALRSGDMILIDENWRHGKIYTKVYCAIRGVFLRIKFRIRAMRKVDLIFH